MRIGIDLVPLRESSGGARYVFADLFRQLIRLDSEHEYLIFAHKRRLSLLDDFLTRDSRARVKIIPVFEQEQIYPHRDGFDLYFSPLNSLRPRVFDRPTVPILHDIQEQYFPQYFSHADLLARNEAYPELCRSATTVLTVSHFSKQCIVEKFGIDARKIEVMHIAAQSGVISPANADHAWTLDPLPPRYFLYPANTYPHKNHEILLDAIERLRTEEEGACPAVVFTGQSMPGGFDLAGAIEKRKLGNTCRHLNHLSDSQMGYLYRHALSTVLPTMFEGFGMPAVEALACGCPLVCSDIPALREVAGNQALYFQAGNLEQLTLRLREISRDEALRRTLSHGGPAAASRFTWEEAGHTVLRVFREAVDRFKSGYSKSVPIISSSSESETNESSRAPAATSRTKTGQKARPRIGILLRTTARGSSAEKAVANAVAGWKAHSPGGLNETAAFAAGEIEVESATLILRQDSSSGAVGGTSLLDFAKREQLDLVGEVFEGNRYLATAFDSLALSFKEEPPASVYLGEVATWKGRKFKGTARLRYSGDGMWNIDQLLYPEMLFISPATLFQWSGGPAIIGKEDPQWRWNLIRAARSERQLCIVRRTLADCQRDSLGGLAWLRAYRAGMLDFHRVDNGRQESSFLRRFERNARMFSQILPTPLADAGTRWWYRLTR